MFWAGTGGIVGFGMAFLPILHRGREFTWWMRGLLIGGGSSSNALAVITDFTMIGQGLRAMWSGRLLLLTFLLLVVAIVFATIRYRRRGREHASWWALTAGALVTLVVVHLAVLAAAMLKRPAATYMLPLAALLPIMLLQSKPLCANWRWGRHALGAIGSVLMLLFVLGLVRTVASYETRADGFRNSAVAISALIEATMPQSGAEGERTFLWAYGSPSHCYGLRFGNIYVERALRSEVNSLCSNEWSYDSWSNQITTDTGTSSFNGDEGWDVLIGPEQYLPGDYAQLGTVVERPDIGLVFVFREGGR